MTLFSEESKLLIENWDAVEGILEAEKQLHVELSSVLRSVEPELVARDWWQAGWAFVLSDEQAYISKHCWQVEDNYAVWIGIENFSPESIFGMETPPSLYVWVSGKRNDLAQMLAEKIRKSKSKLLGEIDNRVSGYVVRLAVKKYLPGDLDHYVQDVKTQVIGFLTHYAEVLSQFDSEIKTYLKPNRRT